MYSARPNLMIGFHGCDKRVRNHLVTNPTIVKKSQEVFDWLGHGFYIWENNYKRALQWALDKKERGNLSVPSVVGVVYQLDYCLDLTDSDFIDLLPTYYKLMKRDLSVANKAQPKNKDLPHDEYHDLVLRELDCAVFEYMHETIDQQIESDIAKQGFSQYRRFDSVRGLFTEGGPAFEGAGIQTKNHIQVCVRNLNCIKGFFIPRKAITFP